MTRFELAASSSRTKRATGLRYIPNRFALQNYTFFQYGAQNVFQFFNQLKMKMLQDAPKRFSNL